MNFCPILSAEAFRFLQAFFLPCRWTLEWCRGDVCVVAIQMSECFGCPWAVLLYQMHRHHHHHQQGAIILEWKTEHRDHWQRAFPVCDFAWQILQTDQKRVDGDKKCEVWVWSGVGVCPQASEELVSVFQMSSTGLWNLTAQPHVYLIVWIVFFF